MLKDNTNRYAFSFLTLCAVSALLYPAVNWEMNTLVWGLLALAVLATGIVLVTK
ncbi:MAG: hypothetical protein Fur0043_14680 [Anaerolineales bacterium]